MLQLGHIRATGEWPTTDKNGIWRFTIVVLAGRATRVPQAAGTSGIHRTVTVSTRGLWYWARGSDVGWGRRLKLHGMQGVSRQLGPKWPSSSRA